MVNFTWRGPGGSPIILSNGQEIHSVDSGSPEGLIDAPEGSVCLGGGAGLGIQHYEKHSAAGSNTGWVSLPAPGTIHVRRPSAVQAIAQSPSVTILEFDNPGALTPPFVTYSGSEFTIEDDATILIRGTIAVELTSGNNKMATVNLEVNGSPIPGAEGITLETQTNDFANAVGGAVLDVSNGDVFRVVASADTINMQTFPSSMILWIRRVA